LKGSESPLLRRWPQTEPTSGGFASTDPQPAKAGCGEPTDNRTVILSAKLNAAHAGRERGCESAEERCRTAAGPAMVPVADGGSTGFAEAEAEPVQGTIHSRPREVAGSPVAERSGGSDTAPRW
jgi:hypothetical protein